GRSWPSSRSPSKADRCGSPSASRRLEGSRSPRSSRCSSCRSSIRSSFSTCGSSSGRRRRARSAEISPPTEPPPSDVAVKTSAHTSRSCRALLVALAIPHAQASPEARGLAEGPPAVGQEATRAVEEDETAPLRGLWRARLERSSTDRVALLGLATLARLTYDYATADALYRQLAVADAAPRGRFTAHALLGQAWALEEQGYSN